MATRAPVGEVRAWAKANGFDIGDRGRLPADVWDAWSATTPQASKSRHRPAQAEAAPPTSVDQSELRDARDRIARLETELEQLTRRLTTLEQQTQAQPQARRRFARNR